MKEDIEKIKDLKAVYGGAIEAGELSIANIIKGGIDLIEKLQEENEELKDKYDVFVKMSSEVIKNSVPVQKVEDKIEELENNKPYLMRFDDWKNKEYTNEDVINNCIEVLQDLLEEKCVEENWRRISYFSESRSNRYIEKRFRKYSNTFFFLYCNQT